MEITKGENENLAGMEPRCPKCGNGLCVIVDTDPNDYQCFAVAISCQDGSCQYKVFPGWDAKDFLPFFRSPAPTPPLDVEAVARELEEEELKRIRAGKLRLTEKEKVELLRRHIASPAPQVRPAQPDTCKCPYAKDQSQEWHLVGSVGCKAAIPAQTEKRDEWVSVDERLPEDSEIVLLFQRDGIASVTTFGVRDNGAWLDYNNTTDDYANEIRKITHWQPLPAPPQNGVTSE